MKRLAVILTIILAVIFVTLSLCDRKSDYNAERLLYKAIKRENVISMNPDVAPPKLVSSVEHSLKKIITRFPESSTVKMAYIKLIELYIHNKDFDKTLSILDEMLERYSNDKALLVRTLYTKASVYELMGQWDNALKLLNTLKDEHADTPLGLQVPLYIAGYYKKTGNTQAMDKAIDAAVSYYKNLREKYKGTALGYASSSLLVQTCLNSGNYETAGELVSSIIDEYPAQASVAQQLPYVEIIFVRELKQQERAIALYENALGKIRDERLKKALETRISALKKSITKETPEPSAKPEPVKE
ncbi:MAG: hypothetical protein A2Z72_02270 [Omnitrophica bacterium RBG_13_46_9]|nr:MAG: hypothetical protein A2Z72_02270 [Omnitrophica bacterium RBG_13_46_9]